MRHKELFPTLFLVLFLGCTSTHRLQIKDSEVALLNQKLSGKTAEVKFKNTQPQEIKVIEISTVQILYEDSISSKKLSKPLHQVESITLRDYGKGALQGSLLGAAGGFTSGFLFANLIMSEEDRLDWGLLIPLVFGARGMLLGGVTGLIVGSMSGSKETYVFENHQRVGQTR